MGVAVTAQWEVAVVGLDVCGRHMLLGCWCGMQLCHAHVGMRATHAQVAVLARGWHMAAGWVAMDTRVGCQRCHEALLPA